MTHPITELDEIDRRLEGNLLVFKELIRKTAEIDKIQAMQRCYGMAANCLIDMWMAANYELKDAILSDLKAALNFIVEDHKNKLAIMDNLNKENSNVDINTTH